MTRSFSKVSILALTAVGACALASSCSSTSSPTETTAGAESMGTVGLQLQVAPGLTLLKANVQHHRSQPIHKSGTIDLAIRPPLAGHHRRLPAGRAIPSR